MPDEYPMHVYHESGEHRAIESADARKKLGAGWSDKPTDLHITALRRASGGVSEVNGVPATTALPVNPPPPAPARTA